MTVHASEDMLRNLLSVEANINDYIHHLNGVLPLASGLYKRYNKSIR